MDAAHLRKLRKKLRQIENLEHLPRALTQSEVAKVSQKLELRSLLERLLSSNVAANPQNAAVKPKDDGKIKHPESQNPEPPPLKAAAKSSQKAPDPFPLQSSAFLVHCLEGHSDLVTCVLIHGSSVISGSWDTTVRVWDVHTRSEQKTLCGHSGAVTCLASLSVGAESLGLSDCSPNEEFVASGSSDCRIIVWGLAIGRPAFSVYTYSEVSSLVHIPDSKRLVSGSDGGKVDVWDLETKENVQSKRVHEDRVTALQIHAGLLFSGSSDGCLKVWRVSSPGSLILLHSCDPLTDSLCGLRSLCVTEDQVYVACQGVCVKAVCWKQDRLTRLTNHTSGAGFVDTAAVTSDGLLVASGFNVDRGHGFLNVRSTQTGRYLGTLSHPDAPRILCLTVSHGPEGLALWVTGGKELLLWQEQPKKRVLDGDAVRFQFCSGFLSSPPETESEDEEDSDLWETDVEPVNVQSDAQRWQWCVLV
ncbi:F-box/WD repeat-containing protein 7-like [Spea bombifrons]|uniref:F-box/WD repeat-containing protein 7-like n=1 Tax=Spea bombifrons TaxID=233779 RepID=UPI0023496B6F|nr:F-box/WD repeat-containing protein 7-like [Spea bombifrons]